MVSPAPVVAAISVAVALIIIGLGLGLGLGIGLRNDNRNLTDVTTTESTTLEDTTLEDTTLEDTTLEDTTTQSTTITTTTTTRVTTTTTPLIIAIFQSFLSTSRPLYVRPNQTTTTAANFYYESIQVNVAISGNYTFTSNSTVDLYGYFYNTSFSVVNPSVNLVSQDDDTALNGQFLFIVSLRSGVTYVLVVTTFSTFVTGTYTVTAVGPGSVSFKSSIPSVSSISYGTLANNGVDNGDSRSVSINVADIITGADGISTNSYVQQVSFNFSVAPTTSSPNIWLYVMSRTTTTGLTFVPTVSYRLPSTSITVNAIGVQTITLPANQLPVVTNQFVAVGLGTTGGSLYAVPNRVQYYLNVTDSALTTLSSATYTNFSSGISFQFTVLTTTLIFG